MDVAKELELLRESWTETFDQLFVLYEISRELAVTLDVDAILDNVATHAFMLLEAEAGAILLMNQETKKLDFQLIKSEKADMMQKLDLHLPVGEGVAGSVAQNGKALLLNEASLNDPRFKQEQVFFRLVGARNLLCVPIVLRTQVIGVIEVINCKKGAFTVKDRDFMAAIANLAAVAIENAKMHRVLTTSQLHERQVLENLPDGFIAINETGRITHINQRAAKALGLPAKGTAGQLYLAALSNEPEIVQHIRLALEEGEAKGWRETVVRSMGTPVYLSTFHLKDQDDRISGVGVILQEITAQKQ